MTDHAELDLVVPDVSHLVTEDDAPVDNIFQEKQMRLLVEPLYSSWRPVNEAGEERRFVAAADVGIFGSIHERAIVPDVLLALDVEVPDEFWRKDRRSYYVWEFGKAPEVVIEIVSNREGEELEAKRAIYSKLRIAHYVVFDVLRLLGDTPLHVFELRGDLLVPASQAIFPRLGVGLAEWNGTFEGKHATWLRWCQIDGQVIPTGQERAEHERERAEHERERAEHERERAEHERERAEHERERAERLAQKLRDLGVDPE